MKKLLLLLLITVRALAQIQPEQPSQGLFNGNIFANGYANWSVPMGLNASFSWTATSFCTANSGGTSFPAFTVGTPITILDQNNPQLNEVVTVTQVNIFATGCSISTTPPAHQHSAFSLSTATAGLQEAINANLSTPVPTTVHLTADWYKAGGNLTMVTATAKGNTNIGIIDDTTTPTNAYSWNGSHYVLTAIAGVSLATYTTPGLQGGGRCFVYPSQITTDAFALINSCSAQLPAGGGLIDATALGTATYTVTTQLTALKNSTQPVVLLLNPGTIFISNEVFNTPTDSPNSCAVSVGGNASAGSAIVVPGHSKFAGNFYAGPSYVGWDLICNGDFTGNQETLMLDGVTAEAFPGAQIGGALIHLQGVFAPTRITNSGTAQCFAQCLEIDAAAGGSSTAAGNILLDNDLFTDGYTGSATYAGSVVKIDALTSAGEVANVLFVGGAIQDNGPHNPLLVIDGRGGVQVQSIQTVNTYFETAVATPSSFWSNVDPIQLTDAAQVLMDPLHVQGNSNSTTQPNLIDISGTAQNTSYGISLGHVSVATSNNYTCLVKNNVEGTCEAGTPAGGAGGDTTIPSPYQFGQFVSQIRQTNVAPPTTPGQCVVGSIWTNSSATTAANSALVCAGPPGNQVYVSFGGGGGGGGLGTLQNDLVGNNAGNTAAVDLLNFFSSSTFTEQQAVNAAFTNVGVATLMPKAVPVSFTNLNDASVVDLEHPPARVHSITEWGAQCNTGQIQAFWTSGANQVAIVNGFFHPSDVGKAMAGVGTVGGIPTAWEPKIVSLTGGGPTNFTTAVMDTNAPFSSTTVFVNLGNDDTAGMTTAFQKAAANGYDLQFPSSGCMAHNLVNAGISFHGVNMSTSRWFSFPGENLLTQGDPSAGASVANNGTHWHDLAPQIDNRIDATKAWQIIDVSGTTSKTAVYQPTGIKTAAANNPLGQGWFIGSGANGTGAIAGVCAISSGSPTLCTVPAGLTLPAATSKIVFPYLSSVFTTTVASVNTGTRVVTLNASYPGSTGTQIVWFAGTSVQTLSANYSVTGCPTTMLLTNPVIPSVTTESNVAPFGLVQVDSEQFTYFGRTNAGAPGTQFLTITGCAQNGTSRAAHSSGATIVPLNPFKPATPWPVTPTINTGFTTPLNAAFYPAWNVGNGFFEAPVANGATGTFGVDSFANSVVENLSIQTTPSTDPYNNNTAFYLVSLPYSTHFSNITIFQTTFGVEEGTPAFNSGAGWAGAQPTADGTHWDGIRISTCNVMNMIAGNQNSYRDFNVYSSCEPTPGNFTGAQTGWYFSYGWNDQTGGLLSATDHTHFSNMYAELESSTGLVPGFEMDGFENIWDDMHMGSGGETYITGTRTHWHGGNFNQQSNFPMLDYGDGDTSDATVLLGSGTIGQTYGTNTLLEYGPNSSWLGTMSQPGGSPSGPIGPVALFGRQPIPAQTNETFNYGNTTFPPFVSSQGGYIPASEINSSFSYESAPFQIPFYYDPTSISGFSAGCNVGASGVACESFRFNQGGSIQVGPGQRIAAGKATLFVQSKSTGAASSYTLQVGVCALRDTASVVVPVTSSYTISAFQIDMTGKGGCAGGIGFSIGGNGSADTITVGAFDVAPVPQQPTDYNLQLLNQLLDSTNSAGTSGFVWTSQGSGSPSHWAASSGGISGGTTNALPKYTGSSAIAPSLFSDNGTTGSYSGTGGFSVTAATPGKFSLVAGTGSIPALAANSWGFAAPNTGGTSALIKPPATMTAGFWFAAAPATNDGVNESALSLVSTEFVFDGGTDLYGAFTSGTLIKSAKMSNAGHFTNLEVSNISSASCTGAPTINVYDLTASTSGTGLVGSTTGSSSGTILDQAQTLPFSAGDRIAIKVQAIGSTCTASEFAVTATVSEP